MSTHVPSFAISKKGSGSTAPRARLRNLAAMAWVGVWVILCGCIVTDEIEFEEEFNQPLKVEDWAPPLDGIIYGCANERVDLTVWVWDPDVDQESWAIAAKVYLSSSIYENKEVVGCSKPVPEQEYPDQVPKYLAQVPIYKIECNIKLGELRIWPSELLSVWVLISDLGFNSSNQPWSNAHTTQVNWTVQVKEVTNCDEAAK